MDDSRRLLRFLLSSIGVLFYIFDEFFGNNFLVNRTADFYFYVAGCPVAFSPANE